MSPVDAQTRDLQAAAEDYAVKSPVTDDVRQDATTEGRATFRQNYWLTAISRPKVLSDLVESLVGAIFIDSQVRLRDGPALFA